MCGSMAEGSSRSEQSLKLTSEERKRYLSKIALLSGIDPYTLKMGDLSEDIAVLPIKSLFSHIDIISTVIFVSLFYLCSYGDIVVYLLYTTSFVTLEEVKIINHSKVTQLDG